MKSKEVIEMFDRYVIGNYARIPLVVVRGAGSRVWDAEGKSYLDLFPGWGVDILGHCHPRVLPTQAIEQRLHRGQDRVRILSRDDAAVDPDLA